MSINRRSGYKTTLECSPLGVDDDNEFIELDGVIEGITGGELTRQEADVSSLTDDFEQMLPGMAQVSDITFDYLYDPEDEGNQTLTDLSLQISPIPLWRITYQVLGLGSGSGEPLQEVFYAWVKGLGREINGTQALKRKVTLRVTGDPGMTGST